MNIPLAQWQTVPAVPYHLSEEFQQFWTELKATHLALDLAENYSVLPAIQLLKSQRIGALRLPIAEGGKDLNIEALFAVLMQLSRIDSNLTHIFHSHFQFVEEVLRHPDAEFKQRWLYEIAQGKIISNALSEATAHNVGSGQYITNIRTQGQQLILNGKKSFTTGTRYADYVLVRAESHLNGQACNVIVPTDRAGVTVQDDWDGIGQRFTASGTTIFENVEVFEQDIMLFQPETLTHKPFAQLFLQAMIVGQAMAVEDVVAVQLKQRKRTFTYGNTSHARDEPLFLEKVGEISAINFVLEEAVLKAARRLDEVIVHLNSPEAFYRVTKQAALDAAKVKVVIDPLALKVADLMFEVLSASSMQRHLNLDQYWRNIRTLATHNPRALKAKVIGDYVVNQKELPNIAYF